MSNTWEKGEPWNNSTIFEGPVHDMRPHIFLFLIALMHENAPHSYFSFETFGRGICSLCCSPWPWHHPCLSSVSLSHYKRSKQFSFQFHNQLMNNNDSYSNWGGYCTPNQKLACLVLYLKIINIFLKKQCMHLIVYMYCARNSKMSSDFK